MEVARRGGAHRTHHPRALRASAVLRRNRVDRPRSIRGRQVVQNDRATLTKGGALNANRSASRAGVVRGLLATAIAVGALAVSPLQAAADCDGPVPSFRDALATAKRVVIGDVIAVRDGGVVEAAANDGWSSRITLRVRYTPVGKAEPTMEVSDLPTQPCAGVVQARKGDRIALAFDATDFSPPIEVNTVAWIRGTPWDYFGVETITVAEAFRLLDLTPPDTATLPEQPTQELPVGLFVALATGALAGGLAWRRSRLAK